VADLGFDLEGGTLSTVGVGVRKSLKVLKVEVKVIFSVFFGHISILMMLKLNREQSERKRKEKN